MSPSYKEAKEINEGYEVLYGKKQKTPKYTIIMTKADPYIEISADGVKTLNFAECPWSKDN